MTHCACKDKALISFKKANTLLSKIVKMMEADKFCVDVMQQSLAVTGLLKSANQMLMENHLKTHAYFAAGQLTVADIAVYGYTHVADRCDFDLATFPAIRAWLRRVEQTPGFVTMDWQPETEVGDAADIEASA